MRGVGRPVIGSAGDKISDHKGQVTLYGGSDVQYSWVLASLFLIKHNITTTTLIKTRTLINLFPDISIPPLQKYFCLHYVKRLLRVSSGVNSEVLILE
jgi:hypothetical protein